MPDFDSYSSTETIKMLYLGDSGAGKTGSLPALAALGFNVRILDVDKGAHIIKGYVTNPTSPYIRARPGLWPADSGELRKRISYVQISETQSNVGGKLVNKGDSWKKITDQLTHWRDGAADYGPLESWTARDILVIDSLSRVADAAMSQQLAMVGRSLKGPEQQDWWPAQNQVDRFLDMLTSQVVSCHVIVIGHIKYIEKDNAITRGMPQTLGKALSPTVGQKFNSALLVQSQGQGALAKRKVLTNTTGVIDLKNPAPLQVKPEYELETALAEYFLAVLGQEPVGRMLKLPAPAPTGPKAHTPSAGAPTPASPIAATPQSPAVSSGASVTTPATLPTSKGLPSNA